MERLAIIADDLTGAMDTGLQFGKRGLETMVSLSWQHTPQAQVLVVDTDSRAARASAAYQRLEQVGRALHKRLIYKKVDSTMRGNIGFELRALQQVLQPERIIVAPAFPPGGRTTLHGRQRVDGEPLEMTFFRHDPRWPMEDSYLPRLLVQQAGREVGQIDVEVVEQGREALAAAIEASAEPLLVVDALTGAHLRTIAEAIVAHQGRWLPCGSAGLADAWIDALAMPQPSPPPRPQGDRRPVLLVSGSRNDRTLAQIKRMIDTRGTPRIDLDPYGCYDPEREATRLASAIVENLRRGEDVILTSSFSALLPGGGARVSRVLADAVARVVALYWPGGLFITGGDTAVAVCHALDVTALRILHEVQAGVPGGRLVGGRLDGAWVVTKAGGFGDEDALLAAVRYLHGEPSGGRATSTTR